MKLGVVAASKRSAAVIRTARAAGVDGVIGTRAGDVFVVSSCQSAGWLRRRWRQRLMGAAAADQRVIHAISSLDELICASVRQRAHQSCLGPRATCRHCQRQPTGNSRTGTSKHRIVVAVPGLQDIERGAPGLQRVAGSSPTQSSVDRPGARNKSSLPLASRNRIVSARAAR